MGNSLGELKKIWRRRENQFPQYHFYGDQSTLFSPNLKRWILSSIIMRPKKDLGNWQFGSETFGHFL